MKEEIFTALCEHNRAVVQANALLNLRAGQKIFSPASQVEMAGWLLPRLGSARSLAELTDEQAEEGQERSLHLPAADAELVRIVMADNPDTLEVLGAPLAVQYRPNGVAPLVVLDGEILQNGTWKGLIEQGYRLPGGRVVEISIRLSYWQTLSSGTDILSLKDKVKDHLNEKAWTDWSTRPDIPLPEVSADAVIPPLLEARYGECSATGEALIAYGVVAKNHNRYYSSDPYFQGQWHRNRQEAETAREKAVAKMEELRAEAVTAQKLELAKQEARLLHEKLCRLKERPELLLGGHLTIRVRGQAESGVLPYNYSSLPDLQRWLTQAQILLQETETWLAAEAQRLEQAALTGGWGGHCYRWESPQVAEQFADFWVVMPNGELRPADQTEYLKGYKDLGNKRWATVSKDELAVSVSWSESDPWKRFVVAHRPAVLTNTQLATILQIETEDLQVTANSFGLVEKKKGAASSPVAAGGPPPDQASMNSLLTRFGSPAKLSEVGKKKK